ncbi:uncharacterized protein BXZ73DRAFT_105772 [Epithele typhae]|uniref:uncharacterized protein n=1 Tax=Epithele typhae TaxID=378194 RepID=UPI00200784D5|nr:uncharacterized protein BXZ73DRAFT_105772 [Epithele typhae]KAH9916579.1 hypothetical protein BXZ73DRAFT_105772 [Epithele typhae]
MSPVFFRHYPRTLGAFLPTTSPPLAPGTCIDAVNLARLAHPTELLPCALYRCASLDPRMLVGGVRVRAGFADAGLVNCVAARTPLAQVRTAAIVAIADCT